jgi:hypothetical protein
MSTFALANLPSVTTLSTALRSLSKEVAPVGFVLVKMDKAGYWSYGSDATEVEDDSKWAINPFSFVHGYIAWGVAEILGEKMVSVSEPLPETDAPPAGAALGWQVQIGLSLKCISGEDKGMEARFSTTSIGGKRAVQALAVLIAEQVDKEPSKPVPIVLLERDHYQHKSYGKTFVPLFKVVEWVSMDGEEPVVEAKPEAAPARRRRSAA